MMLFFHSAYKKLDQQRLKALHDPQLPDKYKKYYAQSLPALDTYLDQLELIALDFETTGLNSIQDKVLSMGGLSIRQGNIDFETAFHKFVKNDVQIQPQTAIVNEITPEMVLAGEEHDQVFDWLFEHLAGKIVITHFSKIEREFLAHELKLERYVLPLLILDTYRLEQWLARIRGQNQNDFRLTSIRERYKLPAYDGHNALSDSLATAELFLVQTKEIFGQKRPTLGPLFKHSF